MNHSLDAFIARVLKNRLKSKDYCLLDNQLFFIMDKGSVNDSLYQSLPSLLAPKLFKVRDSDIICSVGTFPEGYILITFTKF